MAFAAFSQLAVAADFTIAPATRVSSVTPFPHSTSPDTPAAGIAVALTVGPLPPGGTSSVPTWPSQCGASVTGSFCPSDPAGSILLGAPQQYWPLTTCTSSSTACLQVVDFWANNTATGDWKVDIEVKQGTKVIFNTGVINTKQTLSAGEEYFSWDSIAFGPGDCATGTCATPVAGPATVSWTNTVGTTKTTATSIIYLQ